MVHMWWITWRAPVHYVVDDVASTGTLCGGSHGEHRYTMLRMTWRAPVHYVVDEVTSTGTLCFRGACAHLQHLQRQLPVQGGEGAGVEDQVRRHPRAPGLTLPRSRVSLTSRLKPMSRLS